MATCFPPPSTVVLVTRSPLGGCTTRPGDSRCAVDDGHNPRHRDRLERRRAAGRRGHDRQRRDQQPAHGDHRRHRRLRGAALAAGRVPRGRRADRVQEDHPVGHHVAGRPAGARRPHARSGRRDRNHRGACRRAARAVRIGRHRHRRRQRQDRRAAAERTRLLPAVDARHRRRASRGRVAERDAGRRRQRERRARAVQQLPPRRHRQQQPGDQPDRHPAVGRCGPGVQGAVEHLQRRVRPERRGAVQLRHAERHERVPRIGVRVHAQRLPRCEELLRQPRSRHPAVPAQPVRRHVRRADPARQAVLLRQLRGRAHPPGIHARRDRAADGVGERRFLEPADRRRRPGPRLRSRPALRSPYVRAHSRATSSRPR